MPRKDTKEYRDYLRAKRQGLTTGLTGINNLGKGLKAKPLVGGTGLEPVTSCV